MANNIVGNAPNAVVAKSTVSFVDAGINSTNTEIIFLVNAALASYKPGRAINGISGFVANQGYYMVAKQDMDLTAILVPPISGITQLNTPASLTATPTSSTQINLAWSAVASATTYVVDQATNSGFTTGVTLGIYSSSGTSYNNTGLTASTTYYYRVRATAAGYTDSNYATASGTTQSAGGSVEDIVWAQLEHATAPGAGDLIATGTTPEGGTATKKLAKVTGNYVQQTVPSPTTDANTAVLLLVPADDADYRWGVTDNLVYAGVYHYNGTGASNTGSTDGSGNQTLGTVNAGDILRLEISGNDIQVRRSVDGGSSFTTLHIYSGVLASATDIFVKGIIALAGTTRIEHAQGLGLTT